MKLHLVIALPLLLILLSALCCQAEEPNYDQIADAIYLAEGGPRAKVPYGILSVKVSNEAEARKVCLRTIRHAWIDYQIDKPKYGFIDYLGDRYCPPSVDPVGNRNWKRNVKFFLERRP